MKVLESRWCKAASPGTKQVEGDPHISIEEALAKERCLCRWVSSAKDHRFHVVVELSPRTQ
jgi:hypothetical protein